MKMGVLCEILCICVMSPLFLWCCFEKYVYLHVAGKKI